MAASREAQTILSGANGATEHYGQAVVLYNKALITSSRYNMKYVNFIRSKGWGDHIHLSDIYLDTGTQEGVRSIMHGVHPIFNDSSDFRDGDEITVGSKRYKVLLINDNPTSSWRANCFPANWLAVEQLN